MSQGGRSEQVGYLREAIARIAHDGEPAQNFGPGRPAAQVALGENLGLDRILNGGLRRGGLSEVVAAQPGDAGAASGFALALAICFAAGSTAPVVWILEDGARRESGAPYAPGLAAYGFDPARLIVVSTANGGDTLWAMEEALKCRGIAAVLADLWRTKSYDLVASRRLVLAAQKASTPGILVLAGAAGTARALSSAAQARFEVRAATGPPLASADGCLPLPGPAAFAVRLARIRAGPGGLAGPGSLEGYDPETFWPLVWDHEEAWFRHALPLHSPAVPRDRPHPAAASGRSLPFSRLREKVALASARVG